MAPVAIIGGGIAGLTTAATLAHHGVPFRLYEASNQLAGLAKSFADDEGFSYDFGAHFVTNRLAASLGMGAGCHTVRRYAEVVRLDGRQFGYPFGLLRVPRFDVGAAVARAVAPLRDRVAPLKTARAWFRATYGRAFADEVALPLIEAWSGAPASELAASVGEKIPSSLLRTVLLRAAARVSRRAVAIGYCGALPESPHVWHVYPRGGMAAICAKLAEGVGRHVRLESRVERIHIESGRAVGVRVNGKSHAASAVVSTAPVHVLPRLAPDAPALAPLAAFRYRPMIFVNLRMRGRGLLPDVVTWLPEDRFQSFRLTEAPLSMPWLAPFGKTIVTVDLGCQVGDARWKMSDDELTDLALADIEPLVPDARERFLGAHVLRTPVAYPVFHVDYEEHRRRLTTGTGVEGLISVGRNGEFDHLLMEDVFCRTTDRARAVARSLAS